MTGLRVALASFLLLLAATPAPARGEQGRPVVELDRAALTVSAGEELSFQATVRNPGTTEIRGLLAHLAVTSLDGDVYVDPEDWSSERTQYLDPLGPGGAVVTTWEMKAVASGRFVVYVAVTGSQEGSAVDASRSLRLDVTSRSTLNPGSVVPLAVGVPAAVAGLWALAVVRRRRLRSRSAAPPPAPAGPP